MGETLGLTNTNVRKDKLFEETFRVYYPRLRMFILKLIKNEEDAEDLAQDIFVKVWADKLLWTGQIRDVDSYLFRMAKNRVFNYIESKYVRQTYAGRKLQDDEPLEDGVYNYIVAKETALIIRMAIDKMPQQRRTVFLMSREEGLTNAEIAEKLHLSKRTVDNHISLALADLSKIIYFITFFIFD